MAVLPSAPPAELLSLDGGEPWGDLGRHPVWSAVASGAAPRETVRVLVATLYALFTGRARYALASIVSWIDLRDGKEVFADLHRSLTLADADADVGWQALAMAVGLGEEDLDAIRADPPATVEDLVTIAREHGHRSAHEGVGVAWVWERKLPDLLSQLADALATQYGIPENALAHLRHRGSEAGPVRFRVEALAAKYLTTPWEAYEARRAGREVLWDLWALLDGVTQR